MNHVTYSSNVHVLNSNRTHQQVDLPPTELTWLHEHRTHQAYTPRGHISVYPAQSRLHNLLGRPVIDSWPFFGYYSNRIHVGNKPLRTPWFSCFLITYHLLLELESTAIRRTTISPSDVRRIPFNPPRQWHLHLVSPESNSTRHTDNGTEHNTSLLPNTTIYLGLVSVAADVSAYQVFAILSALHHIETFYHNMPPMSVEYMLPHW